MALPHRVQLRRCLSEGHQHHARHPRGVERDRGRRLLTEPAARAETFRRVLIRADGASRSNPGPAAAGAVIIDASLPGADRPDAQPIARISRPLGIQTNNYAEYMGVILALEKALSLGAREVELVLDSKLIVEQLSGRWKVKHPAIRPLAARAMELLRQFDRWSLRHERRENNVQADALANLALDDPSEAALVEETLL